MCFGFNQIRSFTFIYENIIFFSIYLITLNLSGQEIYKNSKNILVKDSSNNLKIEWATVALNHKLYLASNKNGEINIDANSITKKDTIVISAMGYQSKVFYGILVIQQIVALIPDIYELNEVVVSSKIRENIMLGNLKPPTITVSGFLSELNNKNVLYVPNNDKVKGIIKSLKFDVSNVTGGIEMPFKVNIYSKNENHKYPFAEMIIDDIIVTNLKRIKNISK